MPNLQSLNRWKNRDMKDRAHVPEKLETAFAEVIFNEKGEPAAVIWHDPDHFDRWYVRALVQFDKYPVCNSDEEYQTFSSRKQAVGLVTDAIRGKAK